MLSQEAKDRILAGGFAVFLLFVAAYGSWAGMHAKETFDSKPQPDSVAAGNDYRPQGYGQGTRDSPFVVIPAPKTQAEAAQDKTDRESKAESDAWIVRLTGALVIAGLLQFLVLFWQGRNLKATVDQAREEFVIAHPPKIVIRSIRLDLETLTHEVLTAAKFTVVNAGDTTATLFQVVASLILVKPGFPPFKITVESLLLDGPAELKRGQWRTFTATTDSKLTPATVHSIRQFTARLALVGHCRYKDAVGGIRTTGFLREYDMPNIKWVPSTDPDWEFSH